MNNRLWIGAYGADMISSTASLLPPTGVVWYAIQSLHSGTVFANLTEADATLTGTFASLTLVSNHIIYGAFTGLTLSVGAVRCYRNSRS